MNGILIIDKPKNWTSRDVVNKVGHIFKTRKVGHTGTLDPLATGVLVLCIGKYTKLVSKITSLDKEYVATMQLGILTDTLDINGKILKIDNPHITEEQIKEVFNNFPKSYMQNVPKYSAVKINGKKLYEYARKNIDIKVPQRQVEIKELELLKIVENTIFFRVVVSKGTYIRSLINDLANNLHTVAVMTDLRRTKQGNFSISQSFPISAINQNTPLLSVEDLFDYPVVSVDEVTYHKVLNGNKIHLETNEPYVYIAYNNRKIAIYEYKNKDYRLYFML